MKMLGIAAFLFVDLFVLSSGHGINYCGSKMCGYTNAHTFCQFSYKSPKCTGYIPAPLRSEEKKRILARLNRRRNDAAAGRLRGLPCAGNMLKLRWIEELAREAQLWADQCRLPKTPEEHDACRDLYSITVGQCVASVVGEAPGLLVESMVDIWFMQNMHYKGNVTLYEPPVSSKHFYGDFAQIMWARTYMVGCGRSRFMVPMQGRLRTIERLVCNFAPQGPSVNRPLWSPGVPATACPSRSRPHRVLTSLCDYQNQLDRPNDIDDSMSLEEHVLLNAVLEMERNETQNKGSVDEIYLTYLAIVTMQDSYVTTSRYNSMQKRDIVERINIDENSNTNRIKHSDIEKLSNNESQTNKIFSKISKKKLKVIGRPKAYNMEELSDIGGYKKEQNHDTTEVISKRKKDFYVDYGIIDTLDENVTTIDERMNNEKDLNENATPEGPNYAMTQATHDAMVASTDQPRINTINNEEKVVVSTVTVTQNLTNTIPAYNESVKDRTMDDYLSDPETVRQLQAALDRMEREANKSRSSGKIRREVRDALLDEIENVPSDEEVTEAPFMSDTFMLSEREVPTTLPFEGSQNKTVEGVPMLNMMLKYMPYLKNVENELTGKRQNSAICACPSVVLIMIVLCV